MKKLSKILVAIVAVVSCYPAFVVAEPITIVGKDKKVALTLSDGWMEKASSAPAAQLAAVNAARHQYVLVISEPKIDYQDLQRYANIVAKNMSKKVEKPTLSEPQAITVNGQAAIRYELSGFLDGISIVYNITMVETATRFNQVVAWALRSVYTEGKKDIDALANGLKELP